MNQASHDQPRRLLVKLGGAQLEEPAARATIARSLAAARAAGHELVVVHGGGNQIRALSRQLGLEDRYHEGLRITDAATADVVLMVLGGLVNRALVADLHSAGLPAVGLSGADGALFGARKLEAAGVDLGYVGEVERVDPRVALTLLASGYTPVVATVAPLAATVAPLAATVAPVAASGASLAASGASLDASAAQPSAHATGAAQGAGARDHFYNINADMAAGPLARALACDAVLFLTDVAGVLDASKQRLALLSPSDCAALRASGVVSGGMLPKVQSALAALAAHPTALVKIAPAAGPNAVLDALTAAVGTRFCAAADTAGVLA
jgi:acetylglutamate kinase